MYFWPELICDQRSILLNRINDSGEDIMHSLKSNEVFWKLGGP